ncbi:MAG: hypothetical protein A2Y12_19380 [Planctomycetes bacterium GWF2_42_9]|nr:MAG: hypothetical protein A2Y12_19380 [Planctomycetes bacterium GWF2_42_9]HAL45663.1 hypothetical protein [Phycisphaerales bacterium]
MKKTIFRAARIICLCAVILTPAQLQATIIQNISGTSLTGDALLFESQLTITNDTLTVKLSNLSPTASNSPDDLLSSYFFDIYNSIGQRPELVLLTATGDVYQTSKSAADTLQTSNANLEAVSSGDNTWTFKIIDSSLNPYAGFVVGTVGNNNLTPNNLNGSIVGGMDYSIYVGDVSTQSLNGKFLVKDSITFTFSGLTGFSEADILKSYGFGTGTAPDSVLTHTEFPVPEPSMVAILGVGCLLLGKRTKRIARNV